MLPALGKVADTRTSPRIAAGHVAQSLLVMALTRLGSLNALEQTRTSSWWRRTLGEELPSADTLARVAEGIDVEELRDRHAALYRQLKRGKALPAPWHGLVALVLDGHESTASYRRVCEGCLSRTVHAAAGDREQHYHRYVAASLVGEGFHHFIDLEEIASGEDEIAAALRLLARVHKRFPRAYDVAVADGLYAQAPFFKAVVALGKDAIVVLKNEERDLYQDALAVFRDMEPQRFERGTTSVQAWDVEGFTSWPSLDIPVRVVRTVETSRVRRQETGEIEELRAEWMWVTTLSKTRAPTRAVVELGHARWDIENRGFNEGVNENFLDHVYHHEPRAMLVLALLTMLAMNLLGAFYRLNLKPAVRRRHTLRHVARLLAAAIYSGCRGFATG